MFWQSAGDQDLTELVYEGEQFRARNVLHQHDPLKVVVAMEIRGQPAKESMIVLTKWPL